jgi:folate-binding protein YgfZ
VLAEPAPRGQIGVAGADRASYLQGLLTNDITALTAGSGCYAAWLTPQGRLLTDMHVLESGDMILLDLPAETIDDTLARLDQFLFSEDVQLADLRASLRAVSIHGPEAAARLEGALTGLSGAAAWPEYRNARCTFAGEPAACARIDQLGVPGYVVYLAPAGADALREALAAAGVPTASPAASEAARIEAGTPTFGIDMDADTIPLEAGIETRAISFTKGCYVGQEVIIRVLHRGHGRVAKKLMALRVSGEAPVRGAKVFAADKAIGTVTSSADSPRLGAIALAYLHRDFLTAGTHVSVEAGGERVEAVVSDRPMTSGA